MSGQWRNGLQVLGIGIRPTGQRCRRGRLYVGWGAPRNAEFAKIHREGDFSHENGRERRLEAVFRPKMGPRGVEEAQNDDFDRKLTQMDANGGGNRPRSEV